MSSHLILLGPSTAGKTSLMIGLSQTESSYDFTFDRIWTTRTRRPNEGDEENVFVNQEGFDEKRGEFLFPFKTFPSYEYGIKKQKPLADRELRMRSLMPVFALKFRQMVSAPTIFCSVGSFTETPEQIIRSRDPNIEPEDLEQRLQRFYKDSISAQEVSDIHFQNSEGLVEAVMELHTILINYVSKMNL